MLNAELLIDKNNVRAHQATLATQQSNVHLKRMHALEIRADRIRDAEMSVAVMNVPVHQVALGIHIKDACVEKQQLCVPITFVDEMLPVELSIKMNPNVTAHHFIQTEIHIMNVRIEFSMTSFLINIIMY